MDISDSETRASTLLIPQRLHRISASNFKGLPAYSDIANFDEQMNVYLEDLKTVIITKLTETSNYDFIYDPLDEDYRFNLHFKESWYGVKDNTSGNIIIYSTGDYVYIVTPEKESGDIYIYDILGQEILTKNIKESDLTKIRITSGNAYCLVRFQSHEFITTKKVFIK